MDIVQRFFNRVEINYNDPTECWVWTGAKRKERGQFWDGTRQCSAHRFSYEAFIGRKISSNVFIQQLCKNYSCVNPDHMKELKGNARKTHCKRGHPLAGDNLRLVKLGRSCRKCIRYRKKLYQQGKKVHVQSVA